MRQILPVIAAAMALSGCGDSKPQQPLVAAAEKAAVAKFGADRGVKALRVSRTPTATDRIVCGVTKNGEEWIYTRNSANQMLVLTKQDQDFESFILLCADKTRLITVD